MGGAVSATKDQLQDTQKIDLFDEFVGSAQQEKADFNPPAQTNEEKLQFFNDLAPQFETFAKSVGFTDALMKNMNDQYKRMSGEFISENQQMKKVSASQMYREKNGKMEKVVMAGTGRKDGSAPQWRYQPGDPINYQTGKTAFTVRKSLGCGAFGEVHVVWSEVQQRERAMKCTKFDSMTRDMRISMFRPMCDEALLGVKLQHHANIISLRFIKVAGDEFLVIMDLIDGASELQDSYQENIVWDSIDGGRSNWTTPPTVKITSTMAMLWYQLCNAMDHLHSKNIMHCDVKPENALVNTKDLHLYLFDMGLAREGFMKDTQVGGETKSVLTVECDGCTPAYCGPEVLNLFEKFTDGMTVQARKQIQQDCPIDVTCHDLWASALTIFQAVYTTRDGVWVRGDEGPAVLQKYWKAQTAKAAMGKELKEWTVEEVKAAVDSWDIKAKSKPKVMAALEKNSVDGAYLAGISVKADLKTMKGLNVGSRTEFWKEFRPYIALPFDESLYKVFQKTMAPTTAERYPSAAAIMEDLLPIVEMAADMNLVEQIPKRAKEAMGENTQKIILVNIGNALSNHGYYTAAKETYERVLSMQADRPTALKGWATTLSSCQIWNDESESNELCEAGVDYILKKAKEEMNGDLTAKELGQSYNCLWALCTGNGQHAKVVVDFPGFMEGLPKVLDACIAKSSPLTALMCIGVSGSVCVKAPDRRNIMVKVGVPDRIPQLLKTYASNNHINIQTSIVMMDLAQDDALQQILTDNGALQQLIDNWRTYHMDDLVVCYTMPDKLFNFTFNGTDEKLKEWGVADLTRTAMEKYPDSAPMQKFGSSLLGRLPEG